MKEQEPKPVFTFQALCQTHGVIATVPNAMLLMDAMKSHVANYNFKCKDIEIKVFRNGEEMGHSSKV
jgi:uridylate kinase